MKIIMKTTLLRPQGRTYVHFFFGLHSHAHTKHTTQDIKVKALIVSPNIKLLKKTVDVKIPRPRDYQTLTTEEFRVLVEETKEAVHEEAKKAFDAGERELA